MSESFSRRKSRSDKDSRLSYKFQRLRETIRQAIVSGELTGKLPGERALAKKFNCNAKTLGKALTDLAYEGLLDRSIGRGTYVAGTIPPRASQKWLIICDNPSSSSLVEEIKRVQPNVTIISHADPLRPSVLDQFDVVIDVSHQTPVSFIREIVLRGLPVVSTRSEPKTLSTHAVLMDITLGVWKLSRDLLVIGHRHLCAVEAMPGSGLLSILKMAVARYAPEAVITPAQVHSVDTCVRGGATAVVCESADVAHQVRAVLEKASFSIPRDLSLVAVGSNNGQAPCSGYFVNDAQHASAIAEVASKGSARKPTIVWLAGEHIDAGTTAPVSDSLA